LLFSKVSALQKPFFFYYYFLFLFIYFFCMSGTSILFFLLWSAFVANRVALADLLWQMTSLPYVWFGSGLHKVLPGIAEIKRFFVFNFSIS